MSAILKITVRAVGGQGGGVLSNWIVALAEANGHVAQMTSVAGVAQRTGATIYYIEIAPAAAEQMIFALSPTPGNIDVLIAAEIMEAGRAAQRGFLSPDKTTLITSTHRIFAVSEKELPGDGRGDGGAVLDTLAGHAKNIVAFDMERIAQDTGSFISASLFGGLARSGALPFEPDAFRAVLSESPKGAAASLRAFDAALVFEDVADRLPADHADMHIPPSLLSDWQELEKRVSDAPQDAQRMLRAGLRKVVDYQDVAYGAEYLDHVSTFLDFSTDLDQVAAKYIANAMCYDDIIRVADLKTRASRDARLRSEQEIPQDGIVHVTEYFHPRAEEICATLPLGAGEWISARPMAMRVLGLFFRKGRRIRSDRLFGFALLWLLAGLRPKRRKLLRHATERAHLERLIGRAQSCLPERQELAVEVLSCQRLIKGYSDIHALGLSRFDKVMSGLELVEDREDASEWVKRLRTSALADTTGEALDGALKTVRSFTARAA